MIILEAFSKMFIHSFPYQLSFPIKKFWRLFPKRSLPYLNWPLTEPWPGKQDDRIVVQHQTVGFYFYIVGSEWGFTNEAPHMKILKLSSEIFVSMVWHTMSIQKLKAASVIWPYFSDPCPVLSRDKLLTLCEGNPNPNPLQVNNSKFAQKEWHEISIF